VRRADVRDAFAVLEADGACLVSWGVTGKSSVAEAVRAIVGPRLVGLWEPRTLRPHPVPGRKRQVVRQQRLIWEATESGPLPIRGGAAALATEGYGLGLGAPDVVAYLVEQAPSSGGGDVLVDSHRLLATTADEDPGLSDALWSTPVLLRTHPQRPPERRPLARHDGRGRPYVTFTPSCVISPDDEADAAWRGARDAARWHEAAYTAAAVAPRVDVRPGELLLVDNCRTYHGRDAYIGERVVHRAWAWTDRAPGYPMVTQEDADAD
jgi:hypothetical protein